MLKRIRTASLLVILMAFLSSSCQEQEMDAPGCILESIQFSPSNTLAFKTINGGQIYQLKQLTLFEGRTITSSFYQYKYFKDSITISDQLVPSRYGIPYLSVKLENNQPVQVVRHSDATQIKVIYDIDYSDPNRIQISLTRENNIGERLLFSYGIYDLDVNKNVTHVQSYFINTETLSDFILFEDRQLTYDQFFNPMKGLLVPYFTANRLPDVKFFSSQNLLTITENEQVARYSYQYGSEDHTVTQTLPEGSQVVFNYLNCD